MRNGPVHRADAAGKTRKKAQKTLIGRSGRTNIFRLSRRSDEVLVPDSSDDLEAVHTYPLLGDVMYVRNACFRHQKDPADADAEQPDLYADRQQPTIPPEPTYRRLGERISQQPLAMIAPTRSGNFRRLMRPVRLANTRICRARYVSGFAAGGCRRSVWS